MKRWLWIAGGLALAILAFVILAPRHNYMPGPLLAAHAQLGSECSSCHAAWHGPQSQGCVNCHGDNFSENNPHGGFDVTEQGQGLIAGKRLTVSAQRNLECLSCHTEHRGHVVNVKVKAAFACTWCHRHPSIKGVAEHEVPKMARNFFVHHLFVESFNHHQHEQLIEAASMSRPGGFKCEGCHVVKPVAPGKPDQMSFKWSGCAGSGCHINPQDKYLRMPATVGSSPVTITYLSLLKIRHINAVFNHSRGHLRHACQECHFEIPASRNPDDTDSLAIKQCFTCHAHQPMPTRTMPAYHNAFTPISWRHPAGRSHRRADTRVVACWQCHRFHDYGVVPLKDYPSSAPKFPPNHQRATFIVYLPRAGVGHAGLGFYPVPFGFWWLGLLALATAVIGALVWMRYTPAEPVGAESVAGVAPQRTREVPLLDDTYQTSTRHLYVVGEAASTASINLAMRSGRQVIEAIISELKHLKAPVRPDVYDVAIVGCGPAGLGATATAKVSGLNYVTLEKMTPASTLRSYPRAKFVQATPIDIEEYGTFFLEGDNSRENLIKEWEKIIARMGLVINDREEVVDIVRSQDCLVVKTARGHSFAAGCVVLAIGVRGNPRRLGLTGEMPGRVFYNLIEPSEFKGRDILVVGGGNAGSEVAQALAAPELRNRVSYSFRSPVLGNVTRENAERISALQKSTRLQIHPTTTLKEIKPGKVVLDTLAASPMRTTDTGGFTYPLEMNNDVIFALIGAELPTGFLKAIGVRMIRRSN
ncbi:MAG: NAD(P)-binding domain-containing protein [Candidatus Binataceae bacterium]